MSRVRNIQGFTIVELLIVIVVIAIIASISVMSYSGIQKRAINTARISDVHRIIELVTLYNARNGPAALKSVDTSSNAFCVGEGFTDLDPGVGNACFSGSGGAWYMYSSSALNSALKSVGDVSVSSLPPIEQRNSNGSLSQQQSAPELWFMHPTNMVDGEPGFAHINYILYGDNIDCGLRPILDYVSTNNYTTKSDNINNGYNAGITYCEIYIPKE